MSLPKKTNNSRLEFRLHSDDRSVIEQAATLSGQSLSDYAVSSLVKASYAVLQQHQVTQMSMRDRDIFLRLIDEDEAPNAALRAAAARYKARQAQGQS